MAVPSDNSGAGGAGAGHDGGPEDADDAAAKRAAMSEGPPFLTWGKIYVLVVVVLAVQVVIYAVLTRVLR